MTEEFGGSGEDPQPSSDRIQPPSAKAPAGLGHRGLKWMVGIVVTSLGLTLTEGLTGLFSDLGGRLLDRSGMTTTSAMIAPINVTTYYGVDPCESSWIIPRGVEEIPLPPPSAVSSRVEWAEQLNGVLAPPGIVGVVVTGKSSSSVVLTDLRIKVLTREEPLTGSHVVELCGDEVFVRYFAVDLDASPATVSPKAADDLEPGQDQPVNKRAISFPYRVSQQEPEVFEIQASTKQCLCSWVAELHWVADGQSGVTKIDNNGKPFLLSSLTNAPRSYTSEDGHLEPIPQEFVSEN